MVSLKDSPKDSWWFGYLGYDLKNLIENLKSGHPELYEAADLWFMEPGILAKLPTSKKVNNHEDKMEWLKGEQRMGRSAATLYGQFFGVAGI